MNSDFKELLDALNEAEVEYLIVGGYAVIYHSRPRFTKDLDIWLRADAENARKLMHAFREFGMPLIDIEEADFAVAGTQYVIGRPPSAIDFLTSLGSLDFASCYQNRIVETIENTAYPYLGRDDLISSKRIAGRPEDLADIRNLTMLEE